MCFSPCLFILFPFYWRSLVHGERTLFNQVLNLMFCVIFQTIEPRLRIRVCECACMCMNVCVCAVYSLQFDSPSTLAFSFCLDIVLPRVVFLFSPVGGMCASWHYSTSLRFSTYYTIYVARLFVYYLFRRTIGQPLPSLLLLSTSLSTMTLFLHKHPIVCYF